MTAAKADRVVLGLLALGAVLLFSSLNNGYLWQDEAETALVARHTLQFGYPRGTDGRNAIDISPFGYGPGESWIYNPWLTFYLLAGVFAALGQSTWSARLLFAFAGLINLFLSWRLACRMTDNRLMQRLSVALLACSVPFLLHMRQCRYYATTTMFFLAVCLAYLTWMRRPDRRRTVTLGAMLVALFHTNFGTFAPAFAAVLGHQFVWGSRASRRRLWLMAAAVLLLTAPWALWFYRSAFVGAPSLGRLEDHFEYYIRVTNKYLLPLAAILGTTLVWRLLRRKPPIKGRPRPDVLFLIIAASAQLLFLLVPDQRHLRYLMPTLPLLAIGEAAWLSVWWQRQRLAGAALTGLALFTNLLQSAHWKVPLADFAYELTHAYRGPMEGVVEYVNAHGRPGQTAKIPYDDRTLMFYTRLTVEPPATFAQETYPDWIILRRDWMPEGFFESGYFRRIQSRYERIELSAPDILWQNREDPGTHHFRTVQDAPPVVIYRKKPG